MAAGFGLLRLSPAVFWSLTLRELDAALRGLLGPNAQRATPDRSALETLMQHFPDQ